MTKKFLMFLKLQCYNPIFISERVKSKVQSFYVAWSSYWWFYRPWTLSDAGTLYLCLWEKLNTQWTPLTVKKTN